jgi:hypothetical protein
MSKRIVNNIGIRVRQYFGLVRELRTEVGRLVVENNRLSKALTAEKEAHAATKARFSARLELAEAVYFDKRGEQS